MTRIVLAFVRLIALSLSYALSTLAAALFVTFASHLGGEIGWLGSDPEVALDAIGFAFMGWVVFAQTAIGPALIVFATMEVLRLKSFITNALAGIVIALSTAAIYGIAGGGMDGERVRHVATVLLAAGAIGGAVHWVLAGHRSGNWMGPAREERDRPV